MLSVLETRNVTVRMVLRQKWTCFKNLNNTCANHVECWSQYCSNQRCTCANGYEPSDDHTGCRRKLVKIYSNWADANKNNAFCSDRTSCTDIIAECVDDGQHPTAKFCKCPYGYQVKDENERCEPIKTSLLSPLNSLQTSYPECGVCEDNNAVCINITQTTCWCRAGYVKNNNKCERSTNSLMIFPNTYDLNTNDFTSNCANQSNGQYQVDNKLCACAAEYKFDTKDRSCEKIQRTWADDVLEYGSCTRITSNDQAFAENGLCPQPLTCRAREDKYVCSCGKDKFVDMDNSTQCVYFIGKKTNSNDDQCPKYALRNNITGICECPNGYKVVNDNRQCELKLSSEIFSPNSNRLYDEVCTKSFGKRVFLFTDGDCRCSGNQSFPNNANTYCYAPVNQRLVSPMEDCPENSYLNGDHCKCNVGYHATTNSNDCEKAQLVEYQGLTITAANILTESDCKTWFTGPVEPYNHELCQCQNGAFVNDNTTGCWYSLEFVLTNPSDSEYCPPHSSTGTGQSCVCDTGFIKDGNKCAPITTRVYSDDDSTAPSIDGLNDAGCRLWFGTGAMLSTKGRYCICKSAAYAVFENTYCHFLIDEMTADIKGVRTCPANTEIFESNSTTWACVCEKNYYKSSDSRTCNLANIPLIGAVDISTANSTTCQTFTNENCISKYGEFAFCQNEKCYCDRKLSFVNSNNECESLSMNIFPGAHEYDLYSCNTDGDCGNKQNVICGYLPHISAYKVCHCQEGYLLDPETQTCVKYQCFPECRTALNFECRGYKCVCKEGYHQTGSICVANSYKLELHQYCNRTLLGMLSPDVKLNDSLQCDEVCTRVKCKTAYRPEQSQCVRYELNNDKCVYRESMCREIDENSLCSRDENKCLCQPSYYEYETKCVRAVGAACTKDEQCGPVMICKGQRCSCNDKQHEEQILDSFGRPIQRCVNGFDRIRYSSLLLFLIAAIALFFK
ncbi:hypothetical protein I4U23_019603 [Adineta vaga]|nr:hypothetical protein I4U23_019603 [Adineta vaga]